MFESLTQRLSGAFGSLRGQKALTEANIEEGLRTVRTALLEADVQFQLARDFVERVRERALGAEVVKGVAPDQQFVHAVHESLVDLMGPEGARIGFAASGPTVILLAGLQGAGKTTTCAKLAKHLREKHGKRPLLVAADIKRPAAVEQLRVLGRKLDLPVFHEEGRSAPEVCAAGVQAARAQGCDVVLLDTAGRLHVDDELMGEVGEIAAVANPHETILVVDSMTGQDAVRSAEAFHARLSLTGVILTKLDGDARGGAAVSLKAITGCPIYFVGTGEKLDDLDPFHPDRMAGRILGMGDVVSLVEDAQAKISEDEAQASYEKMVLGSFTLEDMLAQIRMFRKLGPMKKVFGMLPGMGGMMDQIDVDDRQMNRLEALFTSMTPKERLHPEMLDMSRRRRVARGAGQEVGSINDLLKSFKAMKQVMKRMNKMGLGAQLGKKQKVEALRGMSADGELTADVPKGGLLRSVFGGGGPAGLGGPAEGLGGDAGGPNLEELFGAGGARPMGSSATRKSGSKKRKDKKRKNNRKKKRK